MTQKLAASLTQGKEPRPNQVMGRGEEREKGMVRGRLGVKEPS